MSDYVKSGDEKTGCETYCITSQINPDEVSANPKKSFFIESSRVTSATIFFNDEKLITVFSSGRRA